MNVGMSFYDKAGQPITFGQWLDLLGRSPGNTVAQHRARGWFVSTIWLGVDYTFGSAAEPLVFETMIFEPGGGVADYLERYSTPAAALAGHDRALAWLKDHAGFDMLAESGDVA